MNPDGDSQGREHRTGSDGSGKAMDVIDPDGNIVELKGPITSAKDKRTASKMRSAAKRKAAAG